MYPHSEIPESSAKVRLAARGDLPRDTHHAMSRENVDSFIEAIEAFNRLAQSPAEAVGLAE